MQPEFSYLTRGRPSIAMDLKNQDAIATLLQLIDGADVVLEGFRPGVMERLGLGPDVCLARNPRLVFARVTGWGQEDRCRRAPAPT
jgi:alpha-methylacyl-CoA racemase